MISITVVINVLFVVVAAVAVSVIESDNYTERKLTIHCIYEFLIFYSTVTQDNSLDTTNFPVEISITSNELELGGKKMDVIVETRNLELQPSPSVHRAKVFINPFPCRDRDLLDDETADALENEICEVEEYTSTRFYNIKIVATDAIGNVGSAICR